MYGIVLAGGGARGAYEIGALRAIKEQGIKIGAICGTSIGAVNAALFAQGDFEKCEKIWREVTTADVVDMTAFSNDKLMSVKNIAAFLEEMRRNKGISLSPFEKMLEKTVSEEKLLLSPIDFGLVTYSLSDNKIIEIFKADIPKGKMVDYLMASCALPGVKARVIDDKTFVDGGFGDNKPVSMLVDRGYRDIISIDVGGVGVVRPYSQNGVNIIEVRCTSPVIGVLDFDSKLINESIELGYLDTKRAFGKISGDIYAFRASDYQRARRTYSKELIEGLESAAELYSVDKLREYTVSSLAKKVVAEYKKFCPQTDGEWADTLSSPQLVFTKVCRTVMEGGSERVAKLASAVLKKYAKAANSVCYFVKKS